MFLLPEIIEAEKSRTSLDLCLNQRRRRYLKIAPTKIVLSERIHYYRSHFQYHRRLKKKQLVSVFSQRFTVCEKLTNLYASTKLLTNI
jgi:hypothetical protein